MRKLAIIIAATFALNADASEPRTVTPSGQWAGQVGAKIAGCAETLLSEEALKDLWLDAEIKGPMPTIDFRKEFALCYMGHGGPALMRLAIEPGGNLVPQYVQKPTWSERLNYLITSVKREGVRSVNGRPIR